uniref:Uncharacterized protein n=1 Tax=Rhizophagus irregularis (strain DAOM 181602 / DAOM 197198 / MUCL 43194) TaxID=747089 RepID=U9TA77_RHIID
MASMLIHRMFEGNIRQGDCFDGWVNTNIGNMLGSPQYNIRCVLPLPPLTS